MTQYKVFLYLFYCVLGLLYDFNSNNSNSSNNINNWQFNGFSISVYKTKITQHIKNVKLTFVLVVFPLEHVRRSRRRTMTDRGFLR